MKVLIIEDTLSSATVVCHQLTRMGATPLHARDGAAGLALFERERPDLVLLDIIMPGMDGFTVASRIRALEGEGEWTPIIFLTSRTSDEDLRRGIEAGGDDYLAKPVSEVVLRAKVRAMQRIAQMRYSLLVVTRKLDEANRELRRLSSVDGLTGIANRRCFDETLAREWRRAMRNQQPLSLVLIDVDAFKQYNDGYGHQDGDTCLKTVASTLAQALRRPTDLAARYGGEEFAAILSDTSPEGAAALAEAMRAAVEAQGIPHRHSPAGPVVTISLGVASCVPDRGDESGYLALIKAADRALYAAKADGRNTVRLFSAPLAEAEAAAG